MLLVSFVYNRGYNNIGCLLIEDYKLVTCILKVTPRL